MRVTELRISMRKLSWILATAKRPTYGKFGGYTRNGNSGPEKNQCKGDPHADHKIPIYFICGCRISHL